MYLVMRSTLVDLCVNKTTVVLTYWSQRLCWSSDKFEASLQRLPHGTTHVFDYRTRHRFYAWCDLSGKCDVKAKSHTDPVIYDDVQEPSPKWVKIEKTWTYRNKFLTIPLKRMFIFQIRINYNLKEGIHSTKCREVV